MPDARILIIEDESITALAIKHKLERLGYSVLAIESCGNKAIEKTKQLEPDLILMDIVLKGDMDGIEAADNIKQRFNIPLIYLTAYADNKTLEKAKLTRPCGYITKPFSEGDLKSTIETALYNHRIECKLRESEENLNAFLNSISEPAFLIDLDGNIEYINEYTESVLGNVINNNIYDISPPEKVEFRRQCVEKAIKTGKIVSFEDESNGKFTEIRIYPISNENGDVLRLSITGVDISDRKKIEHALRESEEKYRRIVETANEGIWAMNNHFKTTFVNQKMAEMLGYTTEEMIGKLVTFFMFTEDLEDHNSKMESRKKGILEHYERRFKHKDGSEIWTTVSVTPLKDKDNSFAGSFAMFTDITQHKKAQKALKYSENKFRELFNNMSSGVAVYEAKNNGSDFIFKDFNKTAEKIENIKKEYVIGNNVLELFPGIKDFGLFEVMQRVWKTGIPEHFPVSFYDDQRITGWRDNYIYKLPSGEVITVYDDITKRKKAEEALKESESKYRNLYSFMNEGVALHRMVFNDAGKAFNYEIIDVNPSYEEIMGIKKENIIGRLATEVYGTQSAPYMDIYSEVASKGKSTSFESYFAPMDKYFSISAFSPKKGEFATVFEDVTLRKKSEEAIKKSEAYYKTIFENTGTATLIVEEDTTVSLVNTEFKKLYGYSKEEIEGKKSWKEFVEDNYVHKMEEYHNLRRINSDLAPRNYEFKFVDNNNEIKDVFATVAVIPGTNKSLVSLLDITSKKKSRKALRESEKKYRQLVENAHEGIWTIDLGSITTFVNQRMVEMLGYSIEEVLNKSILSFVDEKSAEKIEKYLKEPNGPFKWQHDLEFTKKDGKKIYASIETSTIQDENENKIGLLALVSDITDRKKAEEQIKRTNIYHRGLIESSLDPLVTIGPDGKITDVNSATETVTGHPREYLIGTDFSEYFTEPEKARDGYQRVFKDGMVRNYELEIKHKEGAITPVSYNASVYNDEQNNVIGVFAAARDVTELKKAEEEIKSSLKEKEVLLREIHHRVKNNLQIISSLLSLQSNYINDNEALDVFRESQNRVRSMAMIHEKLYKSKSMEKIDFGNYVDELTENLFYNYKISPNMIKLHKKIDDVFFDINTAITCGLIINELITNCLKHAFPWFKTSKSLKESSESLEFGKYKVDIELKPVDENYILIVADNGIGFSDEINFRETDSLGLQLVNNLVEQLDGTIELDKTKGTKFRIIFNESEYEERI